VVLPCGKPSKQIVRLVPLKARISGKFGVLNGTCLKLCNLLVPKKSTNPILAGEIPRSRSAGNDETNKANMSPNSKRTA
jgi:hypothetical protein